MRRKKSATLSNFEYETYDPSFFYIPIEIQPELSDHQTRWSCNPERNCRGGIRVVGHVKKKERANYNMVGIDKGEAISKVKVYEQKSIPLKPPRIFWRHNDVVNSSLKITKIFFYGFGKYQFHRS